MASTSDFMLLGADRKLFEYTSGRWIYNESLRLAERQLVFNAKELERAAAKSVNRPITDVLYIRKLADGDHNRILNIHFRGGPSVLARLPYPYMQPRRLAIASEVATMEFVRSHGIRVPRVLDYSIEDNAVGTDYMLMERLPGTPLCDDWFHLHEQERANIIDDIVNLEAKLFSITLPASGSIYYAKDLPPGFKNVEIPESNGLCIGPYASPQWWCREREGLDVDRGPHLDTSLVLQAPAKKELEWISRFGRPRFPSVRAYRETFGYEKQDPKIHVKSLQDYLRMTPHLIPDGPELNRPILRPLEMVPWYAFVNHDFRINAFTGWQHSVVLPTYLAAGIPPSLRRHKDDPFRLSPPLPQDLENMDCYSRASSIDRYKRSHDHSAYYTATRHMNPLHAQALDRKIGHLERRIFEDAGAP